MNQERVDYALQAVEWSALGIEILAVVLVVASIVLGTIIYVHALVAQRQDHLDSYERYRRRIGRALLLGLEILVAADIIRTVALDTSVRGLVSLGLLVLIRTFLSWSLVLEVEGRWPWSSERRVSSPPTVLTEQPK